MENLLFHFVSVPPLAQQPAVPKTSIKEQFPQSLGLKRRRVVNRASRVHFPLPLSPGSRWLPKSTPSCPFVEPGKGGSTPVPASSRHTPGCHKPQAGFLCFLPHEEESGECYTTHPDPAPCHHRPGRHRPRGGSLCSTMLPLRGYVGGPVGSAGTVSRSLVSAPRSVSVGPADHQTRLRDSVRPASPQVQGCPLHFSESCRCPCPVCGNRSPAGEGCDRTGPSSRYEVGVLQPLLHCAQEKRWVTTDLGSASFEPCTSQAAVQNVDAEERIFGCVRPLDWFAAIDLKDAYFHVSILPRHRPFLRFAFEGRAYQYKVLPFGLSLSPRVFTKVAEAALVPLRERGVRILNYLDDWLILAQSREQLRAHKDLVLRHLSQLAFGSTGKRANSCQHRGSLFSAWSWIRSTRQHASPRNVLSRC